MTEITSAYDWRGRMVIDETSEKIGKIEELYGVHQIDTPEWAMRAHWAGGHPAFGRALVGATPRGEDVQVPVSRKQVNDAPSVEPDEELSERRKSSFSSTTGSNIPPNAR